MTPAPEAEQFVWFTIPEFRSMLNRWLENVEGVRYATDAMDLAHGWPPARSEGN